MADDEQSTLSFREFFLSICLLQPQIQHGGKMAEYRFVVSLLKVYFKLAYIILLFAMFCI